MNLQENLVTSECDSSVVVSRKDTMFACAHNHDLSNKAFDEFRLNMLIVLL